MGGRAVFLYSLNQDCIKIETKKGLLFFYKKEAF